MPRGYPIGTLTAYGNLMSPYWFAPPGREVVRAYYFQDNDRLPQYLTEAVLRARLAEFPNVSRLFGWSAGNLEQADRACASPSARKAARDRSFWKRSTLWDATARTPAYASSSTSIVAERSSASAWCWRCWARRDPPRPRRLPEQTTYRVLHPGPRGLLAILGPDQRWREMVLPCAGPGDATRRT